MQDFKNHRLQFYHFTDNRIRPTLSPFDYFKMDLLHIANDRSWCFFLEHNYLCKWLCTWYYILLWEKKKSIKSILKKNSTSKVKSFRIMSRIHWNSKHRTMKNWWSSPHIYIYIHTHIYVFLSLLMVYEQVHKVLYSKVITRTWQWQRQWNAQVCAYACHARAACFCKVVLQAQQTYIL